MAKWTYCNYLPSIYQTKSFLPYLAQQGHLRRKERRRMTNTTRSRRGSPDKLALTGMGAETSARFSRQVIADDSPNRIKFPLVSCHGSGAGEKPLHWGCYHHWHHHHHHHHQIRLGPGIGSADPLPDNDAAHPEASTLRPTKKNLIRYGTLNGGLES